MSNKKDAAWILCKLLLLIVCSAFIAFCRKWQFIVGALFTVVIATCVIATVKQNKKIFVVLRSLAVIGCIIVLFNVLLFTNMDFDVRLIRGIVAATKIIILGMLVFLFTYSTSINSILTTLHFLPKKLQLTIALTIGLMPSIFAEVQKITFIQRARGVKFSFIKNFYAIIVPFLHRSLKRAEHLAILLCSRGYDVE